MAALGGVLIVLVAIFVRRANARRAAYAGIVLVVLPRRCRPGAGAPLPQRRDRRLPPRHGLVLLGIALYNPGPAARTAAVEPLPRSTAPSNLAVVLNPIKVEDVGQFESLVTAMALESAGPRLPGTTRRSRTRHRHGRGRRGGGADLVLVCGGDGTVREGVRGLAGTGIPVGIVPAGTGNLLARNLDIPLYIRAAIDVALTGQDRAVDMVEVSGDGFEDTHFMVMAGMGFDAAIMEGVNEDIKKRVGWLAYVLSALKSLMFPAVRVEISVDDGEFTKHRARTIVVGNVGFLQAGMPCSRTPPSTTACSTS